MATTKVSALTALTTSDGAEELLINDGGTSKKITIANATANKLPLAGGTMTGDTLHGDSVKAKFGTGNDLEIHHTSGNSFIADSGTGQLFIKASGIDFQNPNGNATLAQMVVGGAVNLHHDGNKKFETTAAGATVTGALAVTGTVDGVDIQTLNTTASAALPKAGGTMTGTLNITNNLPILKFTDSNSGGYYSSVVQEGSSFKILADEGNVGSGQIRLYVGSGAEKIRINSSGNVGIGVVPSAWQSTRPAIQIGTKSAISSYNTDGRTLITTNDYVNSSGTHTYIENGYAMNYEQFSGSHRFQVASSGTAGNAISWTTAMSISNDANVGIGTAIPNEGGFQSGSRVLSIQGASADDFGVIELISPNVTSSNRIGELRFGNLDGGSSFASNAGIRVTRDGADNSSAMGLWTTGTGSFNERIRISSTGNVGIGDPTPESRLKVYSNALTSLKLEMDGVGAPVAQFYSRSGSFNSTILQLYSDRTSSSAYNFLNVKGDVDGTEFTAFKIRGDGKVGIGTASPATLLHLAGSSTGDGGSITLSNSNAGTSAYNEINFKTIGDQDSVLREAASIKCIYVNHGGTNPSGELVLSTKNDAGTLFERMRIDSEGEVLIGTTAQGRETNLAVVGSDQLPTGAWSQFGIYSNDSYAINKGGSMMFGGQDGSTARQFFSAIKGAKENATSGNYAGYLAFYTRPAGAVPIERMRIDSTGTVLINNSNLVIGTSGKGIDFSATSDGAGTDTSELLDDYEEGTWTPTWSGANASNATYTKIGRVVYASGQFAATGSGTTGACGGLPYASAIDGSDGGGSGYHTQDTVSWNVLKISSTGFRFYTGSTQKQLTSSNGTRFFLTYHV